MRRTKAHDGRLEVSASDVETLFSNGPIRVFAESSSVFGTSHTHSSQRGMGMESITKRGRSILRRDREPGDGAQDPFGRPAEKPYLRTAAPQDPPLPSYWESGAKFMDLGATARANGDDVEAARVVRLAADTWGTNHPRYADAIEALAETRTTAGMLEDALALGSEALAQLRVTKGANNPRVTEALLKVSAHHEALGDVPAALEAAVEATTIAAISGRISKLYVAALSVATALGPTDERVEAEAEARRILVDAFTPRPDVNGYPGIAD